MVDSTAFKQALSRFLSGVTVVSVREGDSVHGITVSAFSAVSLVPPLVLVCIDQRARSLALIAAAGRFGVSVLASGHQGYSNTFAGYGTETPVWTDLGQSGVLVGAIAQLDCAVETEMVAGDHTIFVARVHAARSVDGAPLGYWRAKYQDIREA